MQTFSIGKTYYTRSIVNADHIVEITVVSRTPKTIKALYQGVMKTLRISLDYLGNESVKPWGSYSMCPIISAEKVRG